MDIKDKIKNSFVTLVVENKTIKISVKDIASYAGVSRRTFYNYYTDRQAITEEIYMETIEKAIRDCFINKVTTERFIIDVYKAFLVKKDFFLIAINEEGQNSLFDTIIDRSQHVFSYLFKEIITDEKRLEYLSYKYASSQVMLIKKWIKSGMKESPEFMTEIYLDSHMLHENHHDQIINKETNW